MKLRLPHKFQAALMAALASVSFTTLSTGTLGVATGAALLAGQQAQAYSRNLTTTYTTAGDTTYNGYVFTMGNSGTNNFNLRTFQQVVYNEQGQWVNEGNPITSSNNDVVTPLGTGYFWTMYCSTSAAGHGIDFGNTLRLSGATSQQKTKADYSDFTIGGLIAEDNMSGSTASNPAYWIYKDAAMDINGTRDVIMDVNSHVTFSYKGSINLKKGGTWNIHSGKSLTFNNHSTSQGYDTTFIFYENQALIVKGGGTLALETRPISSGDSVNMRAGSSLTVTGQGTTVKLGNSSAGINTINGTITVETGSILNINANTTLGRTITNAGTLTVANGKTVTLTSDLSGFEHEISDYIDYQGQSGNNGFINGADYTIVKNTGTSNLTSVKLAGASTATTLDANGRIHVGGTEYSTYYMNTAGAMLNLDEAVERASQHGGLSKVSVEATNATITVDSAQSLNTLNIADGKSATLSGTGTLMLGSFNNAGTVNLASDTTLQLTANTVNATVAGDGTLRLMKGSNQDTELGTVSATNVELGADGSHNSRFCYTNNSNLTGVQNLYFDGGQLWLNGKNMTEDDAFSGNVTFNTTKYTESGQDILNGAAMRINNSATFNGAVAVDAYTKLAYASGSTITFGGAVTGSGQLDLKSWNNNSGTFTIAGNASTYTGAVTSDSRITLNVADQASLALGAGSNLAGAVTLDGTMTVAGNTTISGAVSGTGSLVVNSGATLMLGGAGLLNVGTLTMNTGSLLDVSNITQMAGITVNLASYTNSVSCTDANITGVNSSLRYTLNTTGGNVTLTFAGEQPLPSHFTPTDDLRNVMYVGDSITDGVTHQKSWRYSFFQVLADVGISQVEEGYYQHHQSSGAIPDGQTASYGGRTFENIHSAQASARSWETAGVPTSQKGGNRYGYSSIQNWLGQSETLRNGNAYTGAVYKDADAPDTFFMLLGTNDLLSEGGDHIGESHFNSVLSSMFGYTNGSFDGTTGTFDIIWKSMTDARSDAQLVIMEMPTWNPSRSGNHDNASDFAYMIKFNQALIGWAENNAKASQITVVDPNRGIIDVANTTKPGAGVANMFIADGLHPSNQGELLMAGNIAKQLGYAGRSVGLARASYTEPGTTTWNAADSASITVTSTAQTFAKNAFSTTDGYTIDFGALYGNGASGGWADKTNGLSVQVGDGYNTGTLTFSEAYVMWGNTILYSRDNSQAGDNFRIAYVNQSVNEADHVSTGYYVWMGDQLIGEALSGVSGSFNGIQLTSTGADGTVNNLTWSNTAYAPTTTLYKNPDETKLFHLEQDNVLPTHDSKVAKSLQIDFTLAKENGNQFGTTGQAATGDLLLKRSGTHTNSWFGPVGAAHDGNVSILYDNLQATTNIFGAINGGVTNGNVSVVLDGGTKVGIGKYDGTGDCSIIGTYGQTIGGDFRVEINHATLDGGIIMGVGNGKGKTIANTLLYINSGASIGGDVFGGNYSSANNNTINGDATICITGGTVNGNVYGGNKKNGTITGDTNITITGGIIKGDVNGGGTGGTITGKTNVTIEGILPSISGNISAQNVTLKDVENPDGYADGFDSYAGTITGTETITLDNYTVADMRAALVTQTLVATNSTETTIHNLTLTACTITANEGTSVTLADNLTLGNTATFSGNVSLADNLTIDASALMQGSPGDQITLFSGTGGSTLGVNDLSSITVTGSGVEDYYLTLGSSGQYLYLDRNATALIPWHEPSEGVIGFQGLNLPASGNYAAGEHVQAIEGHTGTGVYTSVTSGSGVSALYANKRDHTGDVYMLVNGVTMSGSSTYGWIAAHNIGTLTGNASVKVENSGSNKAMLFGAVKTPQDAATTVDGDVYVEVDGGTFATFTPGEGKASYAGSYQADITGEARLVTAGGTFENDVYGGVNTGDNSIGSTTLDLRGGTFNANVYGGGRTGSVTRGTNVTISGTAVVDGSVYGGGNGGSVGGSTLVTLSGGQVKGNVSGGSASGAVNGTTAVVIEKEGTVLGNVYGNTATAQGGTVTLKDRTNGFSNTGVILTEALNLQNTQGTVSSQITAETVNLTDNSIVTINSLTLTPTSDTDTCALTMASGSALTLGGTLSLSDTATYTGALTLTDGMTLDLSRMNLTGMEEEPVTLLTSASGNLSYTDLSSIHINAGTAVYDSHELSVDANNNLVLTFFQPAPGDGLIWDNTTGNSQWDQTSYNWHAGDSAVPGSSKFANDDNVVFQSTSKAVLQENITTGTVQLQNAAALTVDTNGYDMTVSGTVFGTGSILKDGAGTLVLDHANSFSGDLTINDGTVLVSNQNALGTTGNRDVVVNTNGTLALDSEGANSYTLDTLTLNRGSVLTLSGEGELTVGTFNLYAESALDLSKISLNRVGDYVLANVTTLNTSPGSIKAGSDLIEYVSMDGLNGSALQADRLVSLHYDSVNNQVILTLSEAHKGYYWKPTENDAEAKGTWDTTSQVWYNNAGYEGEQYVFPNKQGGSGGDANAADSVYFLDAGEDKVENIVLDFPEVVRPEDESISYPVYVRDLIIAGDGDTYNFTTKDNKQPYYINLDTNRVSNYVVREGATANFEHASINSGEFDVIHISKRATSNMDDIYMIEVRSLNNEGTFNITMDGLLGGGGGQASLGHIDNNGEMSILAKDNGAYIMIDLGETLNREGAKMSLAAQNIMANSLGDGYIHNEGELVFEGSDYGKLPDVYGAMYIQMPVEGSGTLQTTGSDASIMMYATVEQSAMNLGAKLSDFSAAVTIEDTTELKAAAGATATAHFSASSDLGEHVVMGANTTLDLDTYNQAVYTMGEVHSTTDEDKEQELIVHSGVTANVDGEVSLPDGTAQVAGGGKLTIGGASSTVGELAATGGGTAVVELNGATAGPDDDDLVLTVKKLSNAGTATIQVVNTDAASAKTAKFNIGDAEAEEPASSYSGTLQYGLGAGAVSDSGMDLVIKDDAVTEGAVLEATYGQGTTGSVNVIVDTAHAKVVGLTDNISGPDANRAMVVSGTEGANNKILEITGDSTYTYAGKLGGNLDVTYSGKGSQIIEDGVNGFNGKVTVDNGSAQAGVLEILNASRVTITDLTIGANDTLDLKKNDSNVGIAEVSGTMKAGGAGDTPSKLDGSLTMKSGSTYDVSASAGSGGLNLTGALTIEEGALLSAGDLAGVMDLGWFGTYDLAFGVTDMSSFGEDIDWTQGVDASTVFGNEAFGGRKEEFYIRYSTTGEGSTGGNVGAVYIYRIPEPATGTLSLLALAALAARRRRK